VGRQSKTTEEEEGEELVVVEVELRMEIRRGERIERVDLKRVCQDEEAWACLLQESRLTLTLLYLGPRRRQRIQVELLAMDTCAPQQGRPQSHGLRTETLSIKKCIGFQHVSSSHGCAQHRAGTIFAALLRLLFVSRDQE
jgi:hypothetical protein